MIQLKSIVLVLSYGVSTTTLTPYLSTSHATIIHMNQFSDQNRQDLETLWDFLDIKHQLPSKADVAIAGGAGNLTDMAERSADLYQDGIVPLIIVSGFANPYLGGKVPEADLLADVLLKRGVPESAIIKDPNATNTAENILNSIQILKDLNIQPQTVILVHKPFMTRRFYTTAMAQWPHPQPEIYSTSISTSMCDYYNYDQKTNGGHGKMIDLMLGDYERTKEYPKRGWMIAQNIPPEVEQAYQRLSMSNISGKPVTA